MIYLIFLFLQQIYIAVIALVTGRKNLLPVRQVRQAPLRLHPLKTIPGLQHPLTSSMQHPLIPTLPSLLEALPQTTKETLQNPMTVAQQSPHALPCQAHLKMTVMETMAALPNLDLWTTNPSGRVVMVKFATHRAQELVYKTKSNLKPYNSDNPGHKIFIDKDLTKVRATLCYKDRKLRNQGLREMWTHDGLVLVKYVYNKIHLIKNMSDLNQFKSNSKKTQNTMTFCGTHPRQLSRMSFCLKHSRQKRW